MIRGYQYRLYPSKHQLHLLELTLEECRWLYNETITHRKAAWEKRQTSLSLYETHRLLTAWKHDRPSLKTVFSQVLQNVQARVDLAYQGFFRRLKSGKNPGYPRFRGKGWYDSFTYPQFGFSLKGRQIHLSKIGEVSLKLHRPLVGKIKRLTIRRTSTSKWFACFSVEIEDQPIAPEAPASAIAHGAVGIDLGLSSFATFSDGTRIENPHFFRRDERALAKAQRGLSTTGKETPQRAKCRQVVARIHERIANRRANFAHQLSRRFVSSYQVIAFEDLKVEGMLKRHCLAKSIADAAWRQIITYTTYKAASAGRRIVMVSPRNTTKGCSSCGSLIEKTLSDRLHCCPICGLEIDRDLNAALNILRLGLQSAGASPESSRINARE